MSGAAPVHTRPDARVVLHGHFYQPPRDNPWTEAVPVESSARPYPDWNERITAECYRPNTAARVLGPSGLIRAIVDNFAFLSFDVGPTLFAWLERHHPDLVARIVAADRRSVAVHGHGNALAQAYNHAILPLCNDRDRRTQIVWGLREFEHRFRRPAEGMWLPETAIDAATVETLVDCGVQFTVLAPEQARAVRPLGAGDWQEVGGGCIDPAQAYRVLCPRPAPDGAPRGLDVFFFDGPISRAVSFEHVLASADTLAERIALAVRPAQAAPQLATVAVDGETFGHHQPHGDMCIAAFATHKAAARGLRLTNFAAFLAAAPPVQEVELEPGPAGEGTAWSCAHGVGRWCRDCGCSTGAPVGWNQAWRAPLRAALDALRDTGARIFEARGAVLFHDPWAARDAFVDLVLRPDDAAVAEAFFAAHLRLDADHGRRVEALTLLEAQRQSMAMYTSCGWFFADVSGIETLQVMRHAARCAQLLQRFTDEDLESRLVADLAAVPSNLGGETGATLYQRIVQPAVRTVRRSAGAWAVVRLLDGGAEPRALHGYTVRESDPEERRVHGRRARRGHLWLRDRRTRAEHEVSFLAVEMGPRAVRCFVVEADAAGHGRLGAALEALEAEPEMPFQDGALEAALAAIYGGAPVGVAELSEDERRTVAARLAAGRVAGLRSQYRELFEANRHLLEDFAEMALEPPREIRVPCEHTLQVDLEDHAARFAATATPADLEALVAHGREARALGLRLDLEPAARILAAALRREMEALATDGDLGHCEAAERLLDAADALGIALSRAAAEEALDAWLRREPAARTDPAARWEPVRRIARRFRFDVDAWLAAAPVEPVPSAPVGSAEPAA